VGRVRLDEAGIVVEDRLDAVGLLGWLGGEQARERAGLDQRQHDLPLDRREIVGEAIDDRVTCGPEGLGAHVGEPGQLLLVEVRRCVGGRVPVGGGHRPSIARTISTRVVRARHHEPSIRKDGGEEMLRIVRCASAIDRAPELDAYFARHAARLRELEGSADALVGRLEAGGLVHYALVTAWHGFEAMQRALGPNVAGAALLDPVADRLCDSTVEHFERMDLPAKGGGGPATVLRIYSGPIPHRQAEAFYQLTRERAWDEVGRAEGLVTGHVGRRMAADVDHVALVTAWRSWDDLTLAFPDAAERPLVPPDDEGLVQGMRIEHLDIVPPDPADG
jgi:hypothetical protein